MNRSARFGLVAALGLCLAASSAFAQDRARDAQADFQRGVAEMDAHRYPSALDALESSYRLYPSPVALYNLALVHREMGHVQRAIEAFERYLAEGAARVPADRAASVRDTLGQLRAQLARVGLTVTPTPFTTTVDGRECDLPNGELVLDPGDHVVVVTSAGRRPWREELHLSAGQHVTRALTLDPDVASPVVTPPAVVVSQTPAAPLPNPVTPHPRDDQAAPSIVTRWWFWTGVGALVAGGVIAGVVIATSGTEAPLPGTAFDVQTLRLR
jgi:tetratricopeptide (TPR) repeat protein